MRGEAEEPEAIFSYITPSQRVPHDHPLRSVRKVVDAALERMSPRFQRLYSRIGRPSIPPEKLIRALLLQVLYTIRSERQLIEHLNYNILYRWFVGLGLDDPVWDATTFTKNRDRLLQGEVDKVFFDQVVAEAAGRGLLSSEHFTVDGTLVEAWAGLKSFKRKDGSDQQGPPDDPGNPTVNFHGETRSNDTHQSTTDPDARLMTKGNGKEAKLYFMGHVVMENRNGLAVGGGVSHANGTAEREMALDLLGDIPRRRRITLGADKGYDVPAFVAQLRESDVTPHVASKVRGSALDGRTTRHATYEVSQWKRKQVEEIFGWLKTIGMIRKLRHRGLPRVDWIFTFALAAYNLVRIRNLTVAAA
ncbi:MAG TPA: IS5 family transposase [Vicinamibacteria bacterium]|jgi:transposase